MLRKTCAPSKFVVKSPLSGADSLRIGYGKAWATYFKGNLDDVKIYNCKFSDTDILADYQNTVTGLPVDEIYDSQSLSIFPNPNTGSFTIKNLLADTDITIVNTLGQVVFSGKVNTPEVNLKLEKGIYYIKSNAGSQTSLSEKLVIE